MIFVHNIAKSNNVGSIKTTNYPYMHKSTTGICRKSVHDTKKDLLASERVPNTLAVMSQAKYLRAP
jgi:hypothetical protein